MVPRILDILDLLVRLLPQFEQDDHLEQNDDYRQHGDPKNRRAGSVRDEPHKVELSLLPPMGVASDGRS